MVGYSNAAIFASEAIAMTFTIYLGESIIANELLAATKGRAMGWGMVALGFGMAFGIGILMLGYISAHLNPATCLALLILGKIDGVEFISAVGGEFLGAFLGACLVWLHFLPHFKTVPEPPATEEDDLLLRSRDALSPSALGIASYNARTSDVAARQRGFGNLANALEDVRYYLKDTVRPEESLERHSSLVKMALGPEHYKTQASVMDNLRRRSVQVCDVHRRLKDIDMEDFQAMLNIPEVLSRSNTKAQGNGSASGNGSSEQNGHAGGSVEGGDFKGRSGSGSISANANANSGALHRAHSDGDFTARPSTTSVTAQEKVKPQPPPPPPPPAVTARRERLDKLYDAAVIADQNAKLSIFATRPAIYSPFFNFLCEFMCTTALVYGALMIYARRDQLYGPERGAFRAEEGLIIGFFVFVCILGLGGPTGIAANPARDFSPRLAHWLLRIPGKGPSEFYYSWIPFLAPFVGGCAAAGLYAATQLLNNSNVPGEVSWGGVGP